MEDTIDSSTGETLSPETAPAKSPFLKKMIAMATWAAFVLFCLIFFTLLKLPETRLQNFIQGTLSSLLADKGMSFSAKQGHLSLGLGISYSMNDVTLNLSGGESQIQIEEITVSPSIMSIFMGRLGGTIDVRNKDSRLSASFSMKDKSVSFSATAKKFDIGKMGILPIIAGIKGAGLVNGAVSFNGDLSTPNTVQGDIDVTFSKISMEPQVIGGFNIPKINVSEGVAQIRIQNGKASIKTLTLGKTGNTAEDIRGTVTGDATLARQIDASNVNLKIRFGFSESVMKAFVLLDALLGPGKQPDGMYFYQMIGLMSSPDWRPATGGT